MWPTSILWKKIYIKFPAQRLLNAEFESCKIDGVQKGFNRRFGNAAFLGVQD